MDSGNLSALSVWLPLAGALAAAVYFDVRYRRIPNWLAACVLGHGLLLSLLLPEGSGLFDRANFGTVGALATLASFAGVLGAFFFLYVVRVVGAGDAKFIAAIATYFGGWQAVGLVLAVGAAGGLLVLVRLLNRERRRLLASNLKLIWFNVASGGRGPVFNPAVDSADHLPFAVAIAGGTIAFAVYVFLGLGLR